MKAECENIPDHNKELDLQQAGEYFYHREKARFWKEQAEKSYEDYLWALHMSSSHLEEANTHVS